MIDAAAVEQKLRTKYGNLERVAAGIFRALDTYGQRQYAVRYFDLTDQMIRTANDLQVYQEEILSPKYFSGQTAIDLRWNHYLYFVTSDAVSQDDGFRRAKARIEADREYARKTVILEREIETLLVTPQVAVQVMPDDLASTWMKRLAVRGLAYVLDEDVSVPEAARLIADGRKQSVENVVTTADLTPPEREAGQRFLASMLIQGFRPCPQQREHNFGKVNLVVGTNGTGKTSLLEAIEYLYCGQTNRHGEVARKTAITATFVGTSQKLTTSTDTLQQHLRSRHSHWYSKTDLKKLTLSKSFGKFNFLDTDAAVHLSVDASQEQIGPDIARLLLGSEAEKLSDRLLRVKLRIDEFSKDRKRDLITAEQLVSAARERLSSLQKAPQVSDAIFVELTAALKQLTWRDIPPVKQAAAAVTDGLQLASSAAGVFIRASADFSASDEETLQKRREEVLAAIKLASELNERQKAASLELVQAQRIQANLRTRLAALEVLQSYAESNFHKQVADYRVLRKDIESKSSRLLALNDLDSVRARLSDISQQQLDTAILMTEEFLKERNSRLSNARVALRAMEDATGQIAVLRQRLFSAANELLRLTPEHDSCPLCHTSFEAGQLQQQILKNIAEPSETTLGELQNAVLASETDTSKSQQRLNDLQRLRSFIESDQDRTVGEAIDAISLAQHTLVSDQERLAESTAKLQKLAAQGQSEEDLTKQLSTAGLTDVVAPDAISDIKADCAEDLEREQKSQQSASSSLELIAGQFQQLASRFGIDLNSTGEYLLNNLNTQSDSIDSLIQAKRSLDTLVGLQGKTVQGFTVQLQQTQTLLQNLTTAIAREAANTGSAASEEMSIGKLEERIRKAKNELQRLIDAEVLLDELIQQGSGGELATKILSENSAEIARTFAKIHMPNEFEIKTDAGKLLIIRRSTGKAVNLTEMSTGQRAAYALSLFLAMSSRLRSGPPIILFDDPIAHVDDMNVLSFLDHLRDLVIDGSRQIFFATADTKLAGLFRQKFKFLGDEEFREIELTRV